MITREIAIKIANCYYEIEQAEKMIQEMKASIDTNGELQLEDKWGEKRSSLQLHIPSGRGGFYIKGFPADLSMQIIQMHIENQKKELERLKAVCKIQLA